MAEQPFQVTVEKPDPAATTRKDVLILKLVGELGMAAVVGDTKHHTGVDGDTALADALLGALPQSLPALVVVDLGAVTYLSSVGMGALLRFQKWLRSSGTEVRLVGADSIVTLLRRCRLDQVLAFFPDVPAALKA